MNLTRAGPSCAFEDRGLLFALQAENSEHAPVPRLAKCVGCTKLAAQCILRLLDQLQEPWRRHRQLTGPDADGVGNGIGNGA